MPVQLGLHLFEQRPLDYRLMIALIGLSLPPELAKADGVSQYSMDSGLVDRFAGSGWRRLSASAQLQIA